ncbi:MAG: STAS-like domain-containing protein [Patescibacteria group bacterium]|jgi:hypothetical protein
MNIFLKKFGTVLASRQAGKEAYAAFLPILSEINKTEAVILDFSEVISFSPSWGDEFITPLYKKFGKKLSLKNTTNPSVALTISTLEKIHNYPKIKQL